MPQTLRDWPLQWLQRPALCTATATALTVKLTASEGKFTLIADHSGLIHALLPPNTNSQALGDKSIITIQSFTLCMHEPIKKGDPFFLIKIHSFHPAPAQCMQLKPSSQPLHQDPSVKASTEALEAQYNKQDLFLLLEKVLYQLFSLSF